MIEKPILFNGEMVRAVLDGRKTQTRRVIKPLERFSWFDESTATLYGSNPLGRTCPYGAPGDGLWVRENAKIRSSGLTGISSFELVYAADEKVVSCTGGACNPFKPHCWTPSIHMPRWASRIQLEVAGVRVERVQDITAEDAMDEGIDNVWDKGDNSQYSLEECNDMIWTFQQLWDSINGKPRKDGVDISWAANPWLWVVDFKVVSVKS